MLILKYTTLLLSSNVEVPQVLFLSLVEHIPGHLIPVQYLAHSAMHLVSYALGAFALLGLPASLALQFPDCANGPALLTENLVCDTNASPYDRASAIVNAMTIDEKLVNLVE